MSNILIDAEILKRSSEQKELLKKEINQILRLLMDDIHKAKQSYKTGVNTTFPITYNIPGLSNKDSQRIVWSSLITELNEKNYRVKISPTKDKCKVKITLSFTFVLLFGVNCVLLKHRNIKNMRGK